mmetsp:Transcript_3274/g.7772  ORF Transcript_3274/g.7772 Transcript_3274/m.7772 type:complete len:429 (+) Transcript_3274:88-1374(+)
MDLLGDIGANDQLTSTRAENEVLKEQVKTLKQRCSVLTVENEALKAEVEMYRSEVAISGIHSSPLAAGTRPGFVGTPEKDHFVKSGDGTFCQHKSKLLENCHGVSNVLCCSLSMDDAILCTGGADKKLSLALWNHSSDNTSPTTTTTIECDAPVIAVDFSRHGRKSNFVAAGCMDGSVKVCFVETDRSSSNICAEEIAPGRIRHGKYVKCLAWSSTENILATASADGCVQIHKLEWNFIDATGATLEKIQTLQLSGAVESLCFREDHLCCYARGSSCLNCFDLRDNFAQQKINLNRGPGNACFDDHVSFAVMDIAAFQSDYLALATDSSRNIIMDWRSSNQVRNLYGHKNDSYSQPKLAWSKNGQYLYGNSQHESTICVWDIASSSIVERLEGHSNTIRDMYSSSTSDTLVTTSFDKKTQFWTATQDN